MMAAIACLMTLVRFMKSSFLSLFSTRRSMNSVVERIGRALFGLRDSKGLGAGDEGFSILGAFKEREEGGRDISPLDINCSCVNHDEGVGRESSISIFGTEGTSSFLTD